MVMANTEGSGVRLKPKAVVFDVDGVMTTTSFFYSEAGKVLKEFSVDDHDALLLLRPRVEIQFITGDRKGWPITHRRIATDMKFPLELVSTVKRVDWIASKWPLDSVIYMGDGIFDSWVFQKVAYSICPSDACEPAKARASFVTRSPGGKRAVAEACLHILEKFFEPYNPDILPSQFHGSGEWSL